MNRILYFIVLMMMPFSMAYGQELTPDQWKAILNSDNYLIGMGVNAELEEARQTALSDLSGKISTKVQSQFEYVLENKSKGQQVDSETKMKNIIRSYTSTTLKNVSEHLEKEKGKYYFEFDIFY
jgi:nitrogen fixation protein FixH